MIRGGGPGTRRGRLGRVAAALSAAGAAVLVTGALAAGSLPARPAAADPAAAARSVDVDVAASGAALVCPGAPVPVAVGSTAPSRTSTTTASATTGLLRGGSGASLSATALVERPTGEGATGASTSSPAGSPAAPSALAGEALGDLVRVRAPGATTAAGTGTALSADPVDGRAPLLAGATTSAATSGDLRGLVAPACVVPAEQSWLVGGSTGTGRSTRLVIADAAQTATTVDVTVLTADGIQQPSALQGLSLGPGEQRSVLLEGVLDTAAGAAGAAGGAADGVGAPLAVQVRSSAGPVASWLVEGVLHGLVPGGTEVVGPAAEPATSLLVPGVVTAGAAPAVLRVANPGTDPVVARFAVVGESGSSVPAGATPATAVPAGSVVDVVLPGLPAGGVALSVEADGPVLAAVRTDSAPAAVDGDPQPGDLAWVPATGALAGPTLVALPPAPSSSSSSSSSSSRSGSALDARLVVTSRGAAAVDVALVAADGRTGEARRVELPASTTTAADVDDLVRAAGGSGTPVALLLTPVDDGQVVAALATRAPATSGGDLVAASAVSPGPPAPSAVPVSIAAP